MADIDECTSGQVVCPLNSECINFEGGAQCRCLPGYQERENGECRGNTETITTTIKTIKHNATKQNNNKTKQTQLNEETRKHNNIKQQVQQYTTQLNKEKQRKYAKNNSKTTQQKTSVHIQNTTKHNKMIDTPKVRIQ